MSDGISYSRSVKREMIVHTPKKQCCRKNILRAMRASADCSALRDRDAAEYYNKLLSEAGAKHILIEDAPDLGDVRALSCAGCRPAILRGIFLAVGSVSDPASREANLDLSFRSEARADAAEAYLLSVGFGFRRRVRRTSHVLYLKSGEAIGDFFAEAGINRVLFDVSNSGLISDVANFANRRYNADISNLKRSTDASERACDAIRYLASEDKLHLLDEELQKTAQLRLEYPELTLSQLASVSPTAVSKPTLANRLRRIMSLAEELKSKNG